MVCAKIRIWQKYQTNASLHYSEETSNPEKHAHVVTVLDIQNKFTVCSSEFKEILAVLPEWGSFYVLTEDRNLHHFLEKDLRSKLDLLFKKNLYDTSIRYLEFTYSVQPSCLAG